MDWNKIWKLFNRVLTVFAVAMTALWAWKFFGPGSEETRRSGAAALRGAGTSLSSLFWLSIAVVCAGYILWRFMSWLFWRKYFHDDPPRGGK